MVASTLLVLPIRLDNTTSCPRCLAAHIDDIERGKGHFTLAMSNPKKSNDLTSGPNGELIATGTVIARWLGLSGKSVYDLAKSCASAPQSRFLSSRGKRPPLLRPYPRWTTFQNNREKLTRPPNAVWVPCSRSRPTISSSSFATHRAIGLV
jgi:hypothetical protein